VNETAAELRAAGKLWPENLSNAEVVSQWRTCNRGSHPISWSMLADEWSRRFHNHNPGGHK
jgi:hypothetical protein